jgi:hypothetical protein
VLRQHLHQQPQQIQTVQVVIQLGRIVEIELIQHQQLVIQTGRIVEIELIQHQHRLHLAKMPVMIYWQENLQHQHQLPKKAEPIAMTMRSLMS